MAVRPAAAFAPTLLCADGGQAAGGPPLSGVRLCPQGRHHPSPVAALQRSIQGSRLRPESFPAAGWRAGGDRVHRPPEAARGGRPRPASAAAFPAESWLILSSHPQPQGLVLARGPVAAQMYEYSNTENPPNCVGGIREFILYLLIVSSVLTLLLNTSRSYYCCVLFAWSLQAIVYFFPVLRIHEILVRIRIRGSIPLIKGSGSESDPDPAIFVSDLQDVEKIIFKKFFCLLLLKVHLHLHIFSKIKSHKTIGVIVFLFVFLLGS